MASGQDIPKDGQVTTANGSDGLKFTDVFPSGAQPGSDTAQQAADDKPGPRFSGYGRDWSILSRRERNLKEAGESIAVSEPVAIHLRDSIAQSLRSQDKVPADAQLNEAQKKIISDAEAAMRSPTALLNLFTDKAEENSPLRQIVEVTLSRMGIKVESNPSDGRLSIYASRDSLTLNNEAEADSLKISMRHNRLGAPSVLFEQITGDKSLKTGPRPIGWKPEDEKKTVKSISLEDGRKWLQDQYSQSHEQAVNNARTARERAEKAAQEQRETEEAASKRAANADPVIQKSVLTAIDQHGLKTVRAEKVAETIQGILKLDKHSLQKLFDAQTASSPDAMVLKQALENMGLRMEMLTDGSGLAIHRHDTSEALIIAQDGSAKLAKKVPAANGASDLNFDGHRYAQPRERNARMADFLEARMVEGKPFVESAIEKLDLERRYARVLIDKDMDKNLAERLASQKINTASIKNTAIDYLVSMSMGRRMETPIALDRLMRPSPEGSARETERLYFESLMRRAGLQVDVAEGRHVQAGGRWLSMSTSTIDGRSFHYGAGGEITVFGAAGKSTDASSESVAQSFKQTLKTTEHKARVVEELSKVLPKLGIAELGNEDRKAIETLVDRSSTNRGSVFPSYSDRRLKEGLLTRLQEKGLQADLSADRAYIIISSPKQEKRLAVSLNPDNAGRNFGSSVVLVTPPKTEQATEIAKTTIDGWVKESSAESLAKWLIEAKFESESHAREKARSLEARKVEVMKDRARLEYLVEERLQALIPESALSSKQNLSAEKSKEIRQATAKLISAISSISREGVPELNTPKAVPWSIVQQEANSPERQYFEACLRASGFSGRLIVDKETGTKIEGYRLTEAASLREINIPSSSLGFTSNEYNHEPLSAQDRESFRKTVDSSMKVLESINNALLRMPDGGQSIPARDRLAVVENLRQTVLFAQGKAGYDGFARLAGITPEQRILTNAVLKRAGIEMYVFDHASSGFNEGSTLQDISFKFTDQKTGQTQALELGVEFDTRTPSLISDMEDRVKASDALRSSLAQALNAFIVEGKPGQSADSGNNSRKGARLEMPSTVDRARINAMVEYAARANGLNQPEVERAAASVMRSLQGVEGSGFESPLPSAQLKSVLIGALENIGYQAAIVSSKELGLSGADGHTIDLYLYKSGQDCTVLRYKFDQQGKSKGQPEVFQAKSDADGRPYTGVLKASENTADLIRQIGDGIKAAELPSPASSSVETESSRRTSGNGQTINIFVQEAPRKGPAKTAAAKYTEAEFAGVLTKRLESLEVQAKGLSPSQLDEVKARVQSLMQAVKTASEKGGKSIGNEVSSLIPWTKDSAQQKVFIDYLKALDCDVKILEETVAHKSRTDTKYGRLMIGLPGAQAAVVVDSDTYLQPGSDAKAPLALRSKNRMRLVAYDAVDFKGNNGVSEGARALSAGKAAKSFADFFSRVSGTSENRGLEPAASKLRLGKPETKDETRVLVERQHLEQGLLEAERIIAEKLSKAESAEDKAAAEKEKANLESWKGALANPDLSARAQQSLAEQLAVRAREAGKSIRQPAVLLPIIGSILLSTAAQAQSSTEAPIYRQK